MIRLSQLTREICREHWTPERTRCSGCPISQPCSDRVQPLTLAGVQAHVARLDLAAERVAR